MENTTTELLSSSGWTDILDLGALSATRGMEICAHLHAAIGLALCGHRSGVKIVR